MKRPSICTLGGLVLLTLHPSISHADWTFQGDWYNVDVFTEDIPWLNASGTGTNLTLRAAGSCTPTDCNWGTTPMIVLHDPTGMTNDVATASFNFTFETDSFTLLPYGDQLFVTNFNSRGFNSSNIFSKAPPLAVFNLQTNIAVIWAYEATNFTLQVSTSLAAPVSWIQATNQVVLRTIEDIRPGIFRIYYTVLDNPASGLTYYRLKR